MLIYLAVLITHSRSIVAVCNQVMTISVDLGAYDWAADAFII